MNEEQNDIIKDLIVRHLAGEATSEEESKLSEWRAEDSQNEQLLEQFRKTFEKTGTSSRDPKIDQIDVNAEWERFLSATEPKVVTLQLQPSQQWLKIAAVVALLIISGVVVNYILNRESITTVETAESTRQITLPDGTQIDINRNSSLSYSSNFGEKERQITLSGEAYFDVTPDPNKPFTVNLDQASIRVLGTAFNVYGYSSSQQIEVVVSEGSVTMSSGNNEIQLSPGDRGVLQRSNLAISKSDNNDVNFNAWKTGRIVFSESHLSEVIQTLNKVFGDRVVVKTEISDACQVTVTFNQQSLEAIINVLETTLNLGYNQIDETIEIVDATCE